MHFNKADSELLGGGVFKCGKYAGWHMFGAGSLLGPTHATQVVERVCRQLMGSPSQNNSIK